MNEPQPPPPQTLPFAGQRHLREEFVAGFGTPVWPTNPNVPPPPPPHPHPFPPLPTTTTSFLFIRQKLGIMNGRLHSIYQLTIQAVAPSVK